MSKAEFKISIESKKFLFCDNQDCRTEAGHLLLHSECLERQKYGICNFKSGSSLVRKLRLRNKEVTK